MKQESEIEEEVVKQKLQGRGPKFDHHSHACERITEEEYDYQSTVTTRKEIAKLVNS